MEYQAGPGVSLGVLLWFEVICYKTSYNMRRSITGRETDASAQCSLAKTWRISAKSVGWLALLLAGHWWYDMHRPLT
ncbi:hypothetical protein J2S30_001913 [Herbaspirillum rubrisubalbicans]|nr:hypothetical protein [Herbaspirillum rubrisubalbicans]